MVVQKLTKQCLQNFTNKTKPGNPVIPKHKLTEVKNELNNIDSNNIIQSNDLENCSNSLMKTLTNLIGKYTKTL